MPRKRAKPPEEPRPRLPSDEAAAQLTSCRWQQRVRLNRLEDLLAQIAAIEETVRKLRALDLKMQQRLLLLSPERLAELNRDWHEWLKTRRQRLSLAGAPSALSRLPSVCASESRRPRGSKRTG